MPYRTPTTQQFRRFNKESGHKICWSPINEVLTDRMRMKILNQRKSKTNETDWEQAPEWARRYVAEYLKSIRDDIDKLIGTGDEDDSGWDDEIPSL